ncbi:MAG: DUF3048 domain-containing protein [Actinomycetota bacterium]|nr:DUF3048 domain-containing protein [Actinomycetota bacterium]
MLIVLLLSACRRDERAGRPPGGPGEEAARPALCPLTGTQAPAGLDVTRPALGTKIDNAAPARPQAGLEAADIVYEEIAEGGITRFLAIFHCSDAANLGPVRSARVVDPDLLVQYAPVLFAYSGAAPTVLSKVQNTRGITDLRHGDHGDAYRRDRSRQAPYDLFTSTERIRSLDESQGIKGPPRIGLTFDAAAASPPAPTGAAATPGAGAAAAAPGSTVTFSYTGAANAVRYTYEPGTRRYLRFQGDAPHNSASGGQLSAANVVVMKVNIVPGRLRDSAGNFSPEISVIGDGDVTVVRGGTSATGKWRRAGLSDQTTFVDAAGRPIQLAPGNTWIHLISSDRPVTVQ